MAFAILRKSLNSYGYIYLLNTIYVPFDKDIDKNYTHFTGSTAS